MPTLPTPSATFVTTVRLDARTMASLVKWLNDNDVQPKSRGNAVSLCLTALEDLIAERQPELRCQDYHEAFQVLDACQLLPTKSRRALTRALEAESTNTLSSAAKTANDSGSFGNLSIEELLRQNLVGGEPLR